VKKEVADHHHPDTKGAEVNAEGVRIEALWALRGRDGQGQF